LETPINFRPNFHWNPGGATTLKVPGWDWDFLFFHLGLAGEIKGKGSAGTPPFPMVVFPLLGEENFQPIIPF